MADISKIQIEGVDYSVKDETARNNSHTHENKDVLDRIGIGKHNNLTLKTDTGVEAIHWCVHNGMVVDSIEPDENGDLTVAMRISSNTVIPPVTKTIKQHFKTSELENDSGFITAEDIPETPAATDEQVKNAVDEYLAENPVGSEDFTLKEEFNNPHKYPNAQPTANLLNLENLTNGYFVDHTSGKLLANATYSVTEYIPIKPATHYQGKYSRRYAWYDGNKTFISGGNKVLNEVSPENAAYLIMALLETDMADGMIVEGSVYPQKFIPYKTILPWLDCKLPEIHAHDLAVDGATATVNLFNKFALNTGYFVWEEDGNIDASEKHSATDFIACKPNTLLTVNKSARLCFYDKDYRFISGVNIRELDDFSITSPENTAYLRMSTQNNYVESLMVVEGDTVPQIYVPYGVAIPWLHTETKISKYHGKKMVCLGDSITYGGYNKIISEDTGIETFNAGFPSARYAYKASVNEKNYFSLHNIVDAICTGDWSIPDQIIGVEGYTGHASQLEKLKAVDFNTVDFVSFAYGTNDFASYTPYADSDNLYDINTVSGAVRYAIKTLQTKYPHIRIIVSLPIYRFWATDGVVTEDSDTKDYGGGTLPEYCEAIKKAAQDMKIPVVDMYNDGGINEFNRLNYFNITDGTHPNSKGNAVIGHGIAEGVLRYL